MGTLGSKRIYYSRVVKWMAANKIKNVSAALGLIGFLIYLGAITPLGFSGDMTCAGTELDPCIAEITFIANTDIFVYPDQNWGISTNKPMKEIKLYRSWGLGWREYDLNGTCKGTWCGGKRGTTSNAFSFVLREGKKYTLRYETLKFSPYEDIKWWVDELGIPDPVWKGIEEPKSYEELPILKQYSVRKLNCEVVQQGIELKDHTIQCNGTYYQSKWVNVTVGFTNNLSKEDNSLLKSYSVKVNNVKVTTTSSEVKSTGVLLFKKYNYKSEFFLDTINLNESVHIGPNSTVVNFTTGNVLFNNTINGVYVYDIVQDSVDHTTWFNDSTASWWLKANDTRVDSAWNFTTSASDYVQIASPFPSGLANGSICLWHFTTAFASSTDTLFDHDRDAVGGSRLLSDNLGWAFFTDAQGDQLTTTEVPSLNEWFNVCFVWNGTSTNIDKAIYVNGTQLVNGSSTSVSALFTSASTARFGTLFNLENDGFDFAGKMDEITFYNDTLTSQEISDCYDLGLIHQPCNITRNRLYYWSGDNDFIDSFRGLNGTPNNNVIVTGRSSVKEFPRPALIVATDASVEIIDIANNKLWHRIRDASSQVFASNGNVWYDDNTNFLNNSYVNDVFGETVVSSTERDNVYIRSNEYYWTNSTDDICRQNSAINFSFVCDNTTNIATVHDVSSDGSTVVLVGNDTGLQVLDHTVITTVDNTFLSGSNITGVANGVNHYWAANFSQALFRLTTAGVIERNFTTELVALTFNDLSQVNTTANQTFIGVATDSGASLINFTSIAPVIAPTWTQFNLTTTEDTNITNNNVTGNVTGDSPITFTVELIGNTSLASCTIGSLNGFLNVSVVKDQNGLANCTLGATNSGGSDNTTVFINITPVNDIPVWTAFNLSTLININILDENISGNANDVDNASLIFTVVSSASPGNVTCVTTTAGILNATVGTNKVGTFNCTLGASDGLFQANETIFISILNVSVSENVNVTAAGGIIFAPNWSLAVFNETDFFINGNYQINITEFNISIFPEPVFLFNITNNEVTNVTILMNVNETQPWYSTSCFNTPLTTVDTELFNLTSGESKLINCTLDLLNALQQYVDFNLTVNNATWDFSYNFTGLIIGG